MDWIQWGYLGLFVASFLAATILPIASEAIFMLMLLHFNPWICLVVAGTGNTLGGILNYGIGYTGKTEWLEKLNISHERVVRWETQVKRYGIWMALLSWLPIIGDVLAVALGFFKANWKGSFLFMGIGKFVRYAVLLLIFWYGKEI